MNAIFSDCRKYRYSLYRSTGLFAPDVMFIGLNPSTANETKNDPTIRRVVQIATNLGYGGVYMMNLFPLVSPYPSDLLDFYDTPLHDIELSNNDKYLKETRLKCAHVIFAWGAFKQAKQRSEEVKKMFPEALALFVNKDGSPKHPLYCRADIVPVNFNSPCIHENEKLHQGDGFVYVTCADCGVEL